MFLIMMICIAATFVRVTKSNVPRFERYLCGYLIKCNLEPVYFCVTFTPHFQTDIHISYHE